MDSSCFVLFCSSHSPDGHARRDRLIIYEQLAACEVQDFTITENQKVSGEKVERQSQFILAGRISHRELREHRARKRRGGSFSFYLCILHVLCG